MKPIHILLVEDNEGDIYLVTEALEEGKIVNKISVARDGKEALDFLDKKGKYEKEELPDLILLDVNLPKKNGHEVLEYIKEKEALKQIPVIMLTTSSAEKDILMSYKNHANCFITKPVDVDNFLKVIYSIETFWINIVKLPAKK
ncbi:MAG: response regulator [Ferruginibacter sp.]|nr:response regulator [Ferruginibacter sp.]